MTEEGVPPELRRRHAASGVVALGTFLVVHLVTQASALRGTEAWESVAGALERSKVVSVGVVLLVLFPLAFHVALGIAIARRSPAVGRTRAQRWSGIALLVFVLAHAWELAGPRAFLGMSAAESHSRMTAHFSSTWASLPLVALGTILGLALACFHLANGLATASRLFAVGEEGAMRRLSTVLGAVLFVLGTATVLGLATGAGVIPPPSLPSAPCGSAVQMPGQ